MDQLNYSYNLDDIFELFPNHLWECMPILSIKYETSDIFEYDIHHPWCCYRLLGYSTNNTIVWYLISPEFNIIIDIVRNNPDHQWNYEQLFSDPDYIRSILKKYRGYLLSCKEFYNFFTIITFDGMADTLCKKTKYIKREINKHNSKMCLQPYIYKDVLNLIIGYL